MILTELKFLQNFSPDLNFFQNKPITDLVFNKNSSNF